MGVYKGGDFRTRYFSQQRKLIYQSHFMNSLFLSWSFLQLNLNRGRFASNPLPASIFAFNFNSNGSNAKIRY